MQYLTGISGGISSLNYPTTALTDIAYTICVRREYGFCGIEWSESAISSPDAFDLDAGAAADALVAGAVATASDVYITIPGQLVKFDDHLSPQEKKSNLTRNWFISGSLNGVYGGLAFSDGTSATAANIDESSSSVQAFGMPFTLGVNTYDVANAEVMGFNLIYNQIACGAVPHLLISSG